MFVLPLLALTLGHVFSNAIRTLPAVAADVLSRDLGVSAQELAAITGAFPAAFAVAMIPVGVALDRYGVRPVALTLLGIAALGAGLAALAPSAPAMLLAQVVLGVGCSGMLMCPMTFAARSLDAPRFGLWSGIIQTIGNSGMVLTASPLAWLIEVEGWRAGYWACLGLALVAVGTVAATVPAWAPATTAARSILGDAREVLRIAASPRLRGLMAIAFVSFGAVLGVRGLWGGPWLMEVRGLERLEAGHLLLGCTLALVAGPALAGWVVSHFGHVRRLIVLGHGVAALLVLGLFLRGPVWLDAALLVGFGLAISFQVLCFSLLRGSVRQEEAGRALSAMNMFFFGGAAVLQWISGAAAWMGGAGAALLTFVAALLLGCLAFVRWQRD
ncbi:MFS transporter [Sabulicella rubraurantiaca]|uniref:MFS transporter n=1 Tax=Sabulicella rubraurantiaca TaxID=2811429 RepID=UPI002E2E5F70|nr:MFS transporter [Sabulicella rubraurantiaca]